MEAIDILWQGLTAGVCLYSGACIVRKCYRELVGKDNYSESGLINFFLPYPLDRAYRYMGNRLNPIKAESLEQNHF
jgi:hypothetical protein